MNIRNFNGANSRDASRQVRALGPDAVALSNRTLDDGSVGFVGVADCDIASISPAAKGQAVRSSGTSRAALAVAAMPAKHAQGKLSESDVLTKYAPLVRRLGLQLVAKVPASVELDDLIQAGMIALLDAASRYKEDHGAQFETYASLRIRGAMLDELRANDWLPRSMRKTSREVESAVHKLEQNLGRAASEAEIAEHMNMALPEYQSTLQDLHGSQLIYYEDFACSADDEPFLDRYCVDRSDPLSALLDERLRGALIEAIDKLPEREKLLMSLYYERGLNLREIGAVMEVSESRVCQLHGQAVARLRAKLREQAWTGAEA